MYWIHPPPPPPPRLWDSHSIVLVDLNEVPSVFQTVQHSHSRHQKTISNFLRINLIGNLKPHVRDKCLSARELAVLCWSPWLIPHNVLLNARNAGSAGKRTRPWVHPRSSVIHRPIQYGRPNYVNTFVHTKCTSQISSRTCKRVVAYRDCLTHKPITAHHFLLLALPLGSAYRDWLCDGGWTLGMGQRETIFFLPRD